MTGTDLIQRIATALSRFGNRPVPDAARDLFAVLGYPYRPRRPHPRRTGPQFLACWQYPI